MRTPRRIVLAIFRRLFMLPPLEHRLVARTIGTSYFGLLSRLPPNPQQYRTGTIRIVERHGLTLTLDLSDLVDWYIYWGFIDPSLERLIALCPVNASVLDVGANMGISMLRLAARTTGRVVGVEPDPENFARCRRNLEANGSANCKVLNIGLSDRIGVAQLVRPEPHNRGMHRIGAEGVPIELTTLDRLVREQQIPDVGLIKIDVEGHECHVLRGAVETLRQARPTLFVELSDDLLRLQGSSGPELVRQLRSVGYVVTDAATGLPVTPADAVGPAIDVICRSTEAMIAPETR